MKGSGPSFGKLHNGPVWTKLLWYTMAALPFIVLLMLGIYRYSESVLLGNYLSLANEELQFANRYHRMGIEGVYEDILCLSKNPMLSGSRGQITSYKDAPFKMQMRPSLSKGIEGELFTFFKDYGETHTGTAYVYLATVDGGYMTWPETEIPAGYDPRNRAWYQEAVAADGRVVSTEPYIDLVTNKLIISNMTAVYDQQNELIGVVGIDVVNDRLPRMIGDIKVGGVGKGLLLDKSGQILADTMNPKNQFKSASDIGLGSLRLDAAAQMEFQTIRVADDTLGGDILYISTMLTDDGDYVIAAIVSGNAIKEIISTEGRALILIAAFAFSLLLLMMVGGGYLYINNRILGAEVSKGKEAYLSLEDTIPGIVFRSQAAYPWRMISISRACEELTGYGPEEFGVDGHISWGDMIHADDREYVKVSTQGDKPFYEMEYRIVRKDGELLWVYERGTHVGEPGSPDEYIDGLIFDISARKTAEEELEGIRRELEDRVESRTEELKKALVYMNEQEKLASLGAIVSGVAHEINTPLGISVTMTSHMEGLIRENENAFLEGRLSKSGFTHFVAEMKESIGLITNNLQRAANLVSSFKQISVDQNIELENLFNVKDYINMILTSLRHEYKNKRYVFEIICDDDLMVKTYPGAFSQIMTNLIMNSIIHGFKNRTEGHVRMEFIKGVDENGREKLRILYGDDGVGISQDNLKKIYDPFFTTNRQNGGSGLGMNIVYNLVTQKLEGAITCDSTVGVGTSFDISILLKK